MFSLDNHPQLDHVGEEAPRAGAIRSLLACLPIFIRLATSMQY